MHFFFLLKMILFIFGCAGSSLLRGLFSSCSKQGLLSSCVRASHFRGFSYCRADALECVGFGSCGSQTLEHRLSCSAVCGIFLDQGLNSCLLHWQANSLPLNRQGSPVLCTSVPGLIRADTQECDRIGLRSL